MRFQVLHRRLGMVLACRIRIEGFASGVGSGIADCSDLASVACAGIRTSVGIFASPCIGIGIVSDIGTVSEIGVGTDTVSGIGIGADARFGIGPGVGTEFGIGNGTLIGIELGNCIDVWKTCWYVYWYAYSFSYLYSCFLVLRCSALHCMLLYCIV